MLQWAFLTTHLHLLSLLNLPPYVVLPAHFGEHDGDV